MIAGVLAFNIHFELHFLYMSPSHCLYRAGAVWSCYDDLALIMFFALIIVSVQVLLMVDALPVVRSFC
jgi:hypothetical protein